MPRLTLSLLTASVKETNEQIGNIAAIKKQLKHCLDHEDSCFSSVLVSQEMASFIQYIVLEPAFHYRIKDIWIVADGPLIQSHLDWFTNYIRLVIKALDIQDGNNDDYLVVADKKKFLQ